MAVLCLVYPAATEVRYDGNYGNPIILVVKNKNSKNKGKNEIIYQRRSVSNR